jgi:hypothetical protein
LSEARKKTVEVQRVTEYDVSPEQREALRRVLSNILGRPVTGRVTVQLGQGGVSGVKLVEKDS